MKPWFPIDVEAWPEISAMLEARGGEWPQWAATADLRWHVDQRKKFPTRPVLQARWGWSDRRVRAHLTDTATWWDPSKGAPPESRPELRERVNRSGTDLGPKLDRSRTDPEPIRNEQTPEVKQKRTDPEPILDRERTDPEPEMSIARVHHPTPSPITDTLTGTQENNGAPPLVHLDPPSSGAEQATDETTSPALRPPKVPPGPPVALEAVGAPQATTALGLALSSPSRAKPAPAKGMDPEVARVWEAYRAHHPATKSPGKRDIAGAIADHGVDAVLLMVEWVHLDPSEDADYLRRKGYHVNETLWREKTRGRYVYLAEQWQKRGRAAPATTRALPAREQIADDKIAQWAASMSRDVIDVEPLNVITYKEPPC